MKNEPEEYILICQGFTDEETEAEKGKAACPRTHGLEMADSQLSYGLFSPSP